MTWLTILTIKYTLDISITNMLMTKRLTKYTYLGNHDDKVDNSYNQVHSRYLGNQNAHLHPFLKIYII